MQNCEKGCCRVIPKWTNSHPNNYSSYLCMFTHCRKVICKRPPPQLNPSGLQHPQPTSQPSTSGLHRRPVGQGLHRSPARQGIHCSPAMEEMGTENGTKLTGQHSRPCKRSQTSLLLHLASSSTFLSSMILWHRCRVLTSNS